MSTPETFTQWLEENADMVGELVDSIPAEYLHGELFGDNPTARELLKEVPIRCEQMPIKEQSPILPKKRVSKPSPLLLSPWMNKKTKTVPKITRLEFMVGNNIFAMRGEKMENVFESRFGNFVVYGARLILETLTPGLWLDANVVDCWGAVLNYEERSRTAESKRRHFFPTGCITKNMLDGTLTTFEEKWERYFDQVSAQSSSSKFGMALKEIDLAFFPIITSDHFYVVVFGFTPKKVTLTILDNRPKPYDAYKTICELLKKVVCSATEAVWSQYAWEDISSETDNPKIEVEDERKLS